LKKFLTFCIFAIPYLVFNFRGFVKGDKMLIISRKRDEKIIIADEIEITVLEVGRNRVRFGVKAPKHIPIDVRSKKSAPVQALHPIDMEEAEPIDQLVSAAGGYSRGH